MRVHIKTNQKFGITMRSVRLFAIALSLPTLLLISCSDEQGDLSLTSDQPTPDLTIVPNTGGLTIIEGIEGDASSGRAPTAAGDDRGRFNITLKYIVPVTERQEEVFEEAAARWERIIIGDVPSFTGTVPSAFAGFPPAIDGTADDVVIEVALAPIDGPGSILGQAGPRFVRTDDFLTLTGVMFFDIDDLDFLDQLDLFEEVIVHEMGHVLGVGTLWNVAPFGFDRTLREGSDEDPYFSGKMANVHWNAEGGTGELPIESIFAGPGTGLSHWEESTLNNELMTGFLNLGENPLSRITAGSMRDLGYKSATVGESYDLPKGTPGVDANASSEGTSEAGLHIAEMEVLLEPIGIVISN